jgi:hydroxymethylpyrimidine/phosphomethylpyrimidine kinase
MFGLSSDHVIAGIRDLLLPISDVVAINIHEAPYLAPEADNLAACTGALIDAGVTYLLIGGMGTDVHNVQSNLYNETGLVESWKFPRLPHNSLGCHSTLTASIAAHIAHGFDPVEAISKAPHYTFHAMKNTRRIGLGQHIPDRMYWNR